jgi:hypothetical protein
MDNILKQAALLETGSNPGNSLYGRGINIAPVTSHEYLTMLSSVFVSRRNQVIYAGKPVSHFWIMISKRIQVATAWEPGLGTVFDLHVACSGRGGISWNRAETLALYY